MPNQGPTSSAKQLLSRRPKPSYTVVDSIPRISNQVGLREILAVHEAELQFLPQDCLKLPRDIPIPITSVEWANSGYVLTVLVYIKRWVRVAHFTDAVRVIFELRHIAGEWGLMQHTMSHALYMQFEICIYIYRYISVYTCISLLNYINMCTYVYR